MEVVANNYLPGDQHLVDKIVYELKAQGIFDQFRKECFADVDTKPAYQNLRQRVEGSVAGFLKEQSWRPDMNKNQVREMLRKTITESGYLETGVERIVDQVVNPKINTVFLPKVEEVVYNYLGIKRPTKNEPTKSDQIDLLPNDLEAVSPESEPADRKDDKSTEIFQDLDETKTEEDESPPFEPLEEQSVYVPHEENSIDSHLSGFSGLISHESNQSNENKVVPMELDSQMSRNSSDSRLSIVTSDENSKMETGDDSQSKLIKFNESNRNNDDKNKYKSSDKHKSRSESKSEKSERDRKSSKDSKSKHSSYSRDKDKRVRKDSKSTNSSNKNDKDKPKDKEKDKNDKDRKSSGHSSSKHSSYSSTSSSSSNNKDKRVKKESSRSDKDKDKNRTNSNHKDSKPKEKSTKEKSSSLSDKHKHSSSSHSDKHKRDKDKKKDSKSKDDHYSSREKKNDRRSTDRDSNDGQSRHNSSSSSSTENHISQAQKNTQDSSNSGDTGNSDHNDNTTKAPINITGSIQNTEVTISLPETQRVKVLKPKCASNIQEALKLRKIRKQLARLEKKNQLGLADVNVDSSILLSSSINLDDLGRDKEEKSLIREIKDENSKKLISDIEVVPSPLQNTVISQDNWDAMEAKLREEVYSEFKEYGDNFEDSVEDSSVVIEKKEFEVEEKNVEEENCLYFDKVDVGKIEFLLFAEEFIINVGKVIKEHKRKKLKRKFVDNDVKNNNKLLKITPETKGKITRKNNHPGVFCYFASYIFLESIEVAGSEKFPLPLSPAESDKSIDKKDDSTNSFKNKRNSINKINSQRYSSDDLYKPRPTFASSRRRGAKTSDN